MLTLLALLESPILKLDIEGTVQSVFVCMFMCLIIGSYPAGSTRWLTCYWRSPSTPLPENKAPKSNRIRRPSDRYDTELCIRIRIMSSFFLSSWKGTVYYILDITIASYISISLLSRIFYSWINLELWWLLCNWNSVFCILSIKYIELERFFTAGR